MSNETICGSNSGAKKQERDLSLDLVRIVSMSLISVAHCIFYSKAIGVSSGVERGALSFIFAISSSVVNTFVILSGYLLFNKKFKIENLVKLWLEMFFVGVISVGVGAVLGIKINPYKFAASFAPLSIGTYWFIKVYFVLYIIHGAIDKVLNTLSYKKFTFCVLAQMFFICCFCSVNPFIEGPRL